MVDVIMALAAFGSSQPELDEFVQAWWTGSAESLETVIKLVETIRRIAGPGSAQSPETRSAVEYTVRVSFSLVLSSLTAESPETSSDEHA